MTLHDKMNGTVTVKDASGRIVTNISRSSLVGPHRGAALTTEHADAIATLAEAGLLADGGQAHAFLNQSAVMEFYFPENDENGHATGKVDLDAVAAVEPVLRRLQLGTPIDRATQAIINSGVFRDHGLDYDDIPAEAAALLWQEWEASK